MWIFLVLITALCQSLVDVIARKYFRKVHPWIVAWCWSFCVLPITTFVVFHQQPVVIGSHFWSSLIWAGLMGSFSVALYFKAIQSSDLSLTAPMLAFTPSLLLLTSPLMLGESARRFGIIGVALVVLGSYIINFRKSQKNWFSPFVALVKEPGPFYMLVVAIIYSVTGNLDKIGMLNSSPWFWMFSLNLFFTLVLIIPILKTIKQPFSQIAPVWQWVVLMGILNMIGFISQMYALQIAIVPYVISLKRISILFTSLFGFWLFKEKGFAHRLSGAILILAGVFLISFLG